MCLLEGGGGGGGFELLLKIVVQCYYFMYCEFNMVGGKLMIHTPSKGSDQPGPLSLG